jgi:hypothetical protein
VLAGGSVAGEDQEGDAAFFHIDNPPAPPNAVPADRVKIYSDHATLDDFPSAAVGAYCA